MATKPTPKRSTRPPKETAKPELDSEFAHRLRDPFETNFQGVLQPNDPLLLERGHGQVDLYKDLRRDGKVFGGMQKRQLALIGKPWQVEPIDSDGASDSTAAETVTKILKGFAFDKMCQELLEALLTGFTVAEIVWTVRDNLVVPERIIKRAQKRFKFVQENEHAPVWLHLLTRENMVKGIAVPDRKFIIHTVNPEDGNPYGTGLGLQLYWPVFFKRKGIVAWNKLCDRFGAPTPHGKYPRNASPKEKSTLADALRAMTNDGYVMTPEGMDIGLLESKLTGNVTTQQALCNYMDDWIAEVLTGQEPRQSGGGALAAAAEERQDVRQDLTQADSDLLSDTLNQTLIKWICEYNGLEPCMVYRAIKKDKDISAMTESDKTIYDMGFELDEDQAKARYGEGWSKRKETPTISFGDISAAQQAGGNLGLRATRSAITAKEDPIEPTNFSEPANKPEVDLLDQLVDAERSQWQPMLSDMLAPVRELLDHGNKSELTAAELLDRLPGVLADIDPSTLQEGLTGRAFLAHLLALAGISNQ